MDSGDILPCLKSNIGTKKTLAQGFLEISKEGVLGPLRLAESAPDSLGKSLYGPYGIGASVSRPIRLRKAWIPGSQDDPELVLRIGIYKGIAKTPCIETWSVTSVGAYTVYPAGVFSGRAGNLRFIPLLNR